MKNEPSRVDRTQYSNKQNKSSRRNEKRQTGEVIPGFGIDVL